MALLDIFDRAGQASYVKSLIGDILTMAEKTPAVKMMFRAGHKVRFVNAPPDVVDLIGGLPEGVRETDPTDPAEGKSADIIMLFANNRTDLEALLPPLRVLMTPDTLLWVAYHKGSSPVKTDINRDSIWAYARTIGFDAVGNISINEDWSSIRLKQI